MSSRTGISRSAFTLIEVLVVVAIIALLAAVLLPSLARARSSARATICASNLHQFGIAFQTYQAEHRGFIPRGGTYTTMSHWVMLVVRQLGDKRKYLHVNQVPVQSHPVYSCPERSQTYGGGFTDYILNSFHVDGVRSGWAEIAQPTSPNEWRQLAKTLLVGDAALEQGGPVDAGSPHLKQNRLNHPAAMQLTDLSRFNESLHASLDRMDMFLPEHVQSENSTRRAGTRVHMNTSCNWLHGDGHAARVAWLDGKRSRDDWLRMYGVKYTR